VFIGTLYPLFPDAVGGPKISVGFPFFNQTFVPLMVPLLLAVGPGSMLAWKRGDLLAVLQRLWAAFGFAVLVILAAFYVTHGGPVLAVLGLGLAAWTFAGAAVVLAERLQLFRVPAGDSLRRALHMPRAAWGMTFAHMGLAITVAGIAASAFESEAIDVVKPGGETQLAGYTLHFDGVERRAGPNYIYDDAAITISSNGRTLAVVHPQRRFFPVQQQTTAVTAIRTNLLADLYVALGDPDAAGGWTIRAYYKPLVPWIWLGAVFMAFGGMVSLSDRRWRIGVAARARGAALQPAAGE
jgi:cytochrome c-type biogenesis protein CcmF